MKLVSRISLHQDERVKPSHLLLYGVSIKGSTKHTTFFSSPSFSKFQFPFTSSQTRVCRLSLSHQPSTSVLNLSNLGLGRLQQHQLSAVLLIFPGSSLWTPTLVNYLQFSISARQVFRMSPSIVPLPKLFSNKLSLGKKSRGEVRPLPPSALDDSVKRTQLKEFKLLPSIFNPFSNVAGQQSRGCSSSSISSTHSPPPPPPPAASNLRSASHVSLPQPLAINTESSKFKNKKHLSLADKKYFLHSAASSSSSSAVASPASAGTRVSPARFD